MTTSLASFRDAYAAQRAAEGRAYTLDELLALPYLASGPHAKQWAVRARTFDAFARSVLVPLIARTEASGGGPPTSTLEPAANGRVIERTQAGPRRRILDLGAGNGWLSWHAARAGFDAVALDLRDDTIDGLGAATPYVERAHFERVAGSFDALPIADQSFDVVVFNASLHYAIDLARVLREARRVTRTGGRIVILDSPFYTRDADGAAMVAEKHRAAWQRFGERADVLLAPSHIEYLTVERLTNASRGLSLAFTRRRVTYPLWYELRPLVARLRGRRTPSRFDLWESIAA